MLLSVSQWLGALYAAMILSVCFAFAVLLSLARIGLRAMRKVPPAEKKEEEAKEEPRGNAPEPVYYIVEKKKKRARAEYSDPKRISFK